MPAVGLAEASAEALELALVLAVQALVQALVPALVPALALVLRLLAVRLASLDLLISPQCTALIESTHAVSHMLRHSSPAHSSTAAPDTKSAYYREQFILWILSFFTCREKNVITVLKKPLNKLSFHALFGSCRFFLTRHKLLFKIDLLVSGHDRKRGHWAHLAS